MSLQYLYFLSTFTCLVGFVWPSFDVPFLLWLSFVFPVRADPSCRSSALRVYEKCRQQLADLTSLVVLLLCVYSLLYEDIPLSSLSAERERSASSVLLLMTPLQTIILILVASVFTFEVGLHIRLTCQPKHIQRFQEARTNVNKMIIHHVLGWIGIAYMIHIGYGGGLMVRLLLDVITDFFAEACGELNARLKNFTGDKIYWIVFILVRMVWYPYVLSNAIYACYTLPLSASGATLYQTQFLWFCMLCVWFIFSTIYHITWIKNDFTWY